MSAASDSYKNIVSKLKASFEDTPKKDENGIYLTESEDLDKEQKIAIHLEELRTKREYNKLLRQNRRERKKFAFWIFIFTCCWTLLIFFILFLNGLKNVSGRQYFDFHLSDQVLITLITSTTVNFLVFFLLVVKYLFHVEGEKEKSKEEKK